MKRNHLGTTVKALCLATSLGAASVSAQDFTIGAQGCMPMNLGLAKTLQWRSEGLINNNTVEQWVVCPLALDTFDDNVDVVARIRNRSEQRATVQCLYKTTNAVGNPKKSFSLKQPIDPGEAWTLGYSNVNFLPGDALSVSCLLPPQFSITSFSVELPEG